MSTQSPLDVLRDAFYGGITTSPHTIDAALAQVQTLVDAARQRQECGHDDTCDVAFILPETFIYDPTRPCDCGYAALEDALAPFRSETRTGDDT